MSVCESEVNQIRVGDECTYRVYRLLSHRVACKPAICRLRHNHIDATSVAWKLYEKKGMQSRNYLGNDVIRGQ